LFVKPQQRSLGWNFWAQSSIFQQFLPTAHVGPNAHQASLNNFFDMPRLPASPATKAQRSAPDDRLPRRAKNPLQPYLRLAVMAGVSLAAVWAISACAPRSAQAQTLAQAHVQREQALASAVGMPDATSFQSMDFSWQDTMRQREVLARLYTPANATGRVPLVVLSHGIGGSREGYTYIGKHLASQGYACLHLQHAGSDRSLWFGNPLQMVGRLQAAAKDTEAIDRAKDVSFALDQLLATANMKAQLDPQRVAMAGHSYGANTTMLVAGAQVDRDGKIFNLRDDRIKAAVLISAPPFYNSGDAKQILASVTIPTLHITSTGDDIRIPGYFSSAKDRVAMFDATPTIAPKTLALFKDGSHSMFTDRLGTGGISLNPQVKVATRELITAFLQAEFDKDKTALDHWPRKHGALLAKFDAR
jgi:dienelactone hydrolase